MSRNTRKVHIVMAYDHELGTLYISEVCSSKKKADKYKVYINRIMNEDGKNPFRYSHWVCDKRVV